MDSGFAADKPRISGDGKTTLTAAYVKTPQKLNIKINIRVIHYQLVDRGGLGGCVGGFLGGGGGLESVGFFGLGQGISISG